MTTFEPNEAGAANANASQDSNGRCRRKPILSREEILAQIESLNGLVAVKLISTAQASVMLRGLTVLLNESNQNSKDNAGSANLEALAALYRQSPATLDAIWPFLTDEQKDMFTKLAAQQDK